MKLVIDITDEMWQAVQDGWVGNELWHSALKNGTPLPEGMIDANKVQEKIDKLLKEPDYQHEGEDWRAGLIMAEELINDAFATIESEE